MARPARGTRPIVVDGIIFRWKVAPPLPNTDCPLCASWHVVVITDSDHELVAEWEVDVDSETGRPLAVTPRQVGEHLRGRTARPRTETRKTHEHDRRAHRARHRLKG